MKHRIFLLFAFCTMISVTAENKVISREYISFEVPENAGSDKTIMRQGILVRRAGARATLLIVHGFMCDKYDIDFLSHLLGEHVVHAQPGSDEKDTVYRYNTFTIDLRAHGENKQNQCCSFGKNEALDVRAAAHYLKSRADLKEMPLGVYGFSMGAVSSIVAQSQEPLFDFGISDCPFDSTENIIARGLEHLKISLWGYEIPLPGRSLLHRYAYNPYVQSFLKLVFKAVSRMDSGNIAVCMAPVNTVDAAKSITKPWLFITCKNDEKAPVKAVTAVYNEAQGFKRLVVTQGRRHFDSLFYNTISYVERIHKHIRLVLDGSYTKKPCQKITIEGEECNSKKGSELL